MPYDFLGIALCCTAILLAVLGCSWPAWLRIVTVLTGVALFCTCLVAGSEPDPFEE